MTRAAPPDLRLARVRLRDRGVADVLDLAVRFVVDNGRSYAKVAIATVVPAAAIAIAVGSFAGWPTAWAVTLPLGLLAEVPFTVLASRLVFEEHVRTRDVLASAVADAPRVLLGRVVGLVLTAIGLAALVLPGVWLGAIFLFLGEVMLLERASLGRAFGRSQRVVGTALPDVLVGLVVLALLAPVAVLLADVGGRAVLGELLQFRPPRPVWVSGGGVLATLGLLGAVPYLATARFLLYLNVRTRAEGWDIQTRFAALALRRAQADEPTSTGAA